MKRIVLWAAGGLALLIGGTLAGGIYWIDGIAKSAVEKGATWAFGVSTSVESVEIGLFSGEASIHRLEVANPPDFSERPFFALDDGRVAVSIGSLREDVVELPHLRLSGLRMTLEKRRGRANYEAILDGLKRFESAPTSPADQRDGKRFVVRDVTVEDVTVDVELLPLNGPLTRMPVMIERIELHDLGSDSDHGMVMGELTGTIMKAVLQAVLRQAGTVLPAEIVRELGAGLDGLGRLAVGSIQVTGEATVMVAGEAVKIAEFGATVAKDVVTHGAEVAKTVGEDIGKGLGGLLNPKKAKPDEKEPDDKESGEKKPD